MSESAHAAENRVQRRPEPYHWYSPPLDENLMWRNICFRAGSQAGGILTSQLKATNGLVSGAGLDLPTPPISGAGQLSSQELQGLFINQQVGYAQPAVNDTNLQIVKREPEDLSHHRKIDCSSPSSGSLDGSIIISKQPRAKVNHSAVLLLSLISAIGSVSVSDTCFLCKWWVICSDFLWIQHLFQ